MAEQIADFEAGRGLTAAARPAASGHGSLVQSQLTQAHVRATAEAFYIGSWTSHVFWKVVLLLEP